MKRSLRVSVLTGVAALVLGLGGVAVPAFADITSSSSSSASSTTTQSKSITATFNTDPTATISLNSAPNIGFGANATPDTTSNEVYTATTADAPVSVSNPGLASGYNVKVQNSAFTNADGDTLGGAVLSLGAPDVEAANVGNPSPAPTASAVTLSGNSADSLLLSAPLKGGLGVFNSNFGLANVTLAVPAGQLGGAYSSTLTYTLGDTVQ